MKTIVCPIDMSDFSRPVLSHATALGRWYGAEVVALHVFASVMPPATLGAYPAWMLQLPEGREAIKQELRSFLEPYFTDTPALRLHTAEGDPAVEILRHASELHADLLVMGTHGRSGFNRLTLGSVTEKVLRRAPCPVFTLPPEAPVATTDITYRHILCTTDFSSSSECGLDMAISLARNSHARITVLHVIESTETADIDRMSRALHSFVLPHIANSDDVRNLVAIGKPHQEIVRTARDLPADVIVIGVRGRGPVDLTLFGSTTNQVVRRAECPVITVRSKGEAS